MFMFFYFYKPLSHFIPWLVCPVAVMSPLSLAICRMQMRSVFLCKEEKKKRVYLQWLECNLRLICIIQLSGKKGMGRMLRSRWQQGCMSWGYTESQDSEIWHRACKWQGDVCSVKWFGGVSCETIWKMAKSQGVGQWCMIAVFPAVCKAVPRLMQTIERCNIE